MSEKNNVRLTASENVTGYEERDKLIDQAREITNLRDSIDEKTRELAHSQQILSQKDRVLYDRRVQLEELRLKAEQDFDFSQNHVAEHANRNANLSLKLRKIQKAIVKLRSRKILIQTEIEEKREENTLKQMKIKKETTEAKIKFDASRADHQKEIEALKKELFKIINSANFENWTNKQKATIEDLKLKRDLEDKENDVFEVEKNRLEQELASLTGSQEVSFSDQRKIGNLRKKKAELQEKLAKLESGIDVDLNNKNQVNKKPSLNIAVDQEDEDEELNFADSIEVETAPIFNIQAPTLVQSAPLIDDHSHLPISEPPETPPPQDLELRFATSSKHVQSAPQSQSRTRTINQGFGNSGQNFSKSSTSQNIKQSSNGGFTKTTYSSNSKSFASPIPAARKNYSSEGNSKPESSSSRFELAGFDFSNSRSKSGFTNWESNQPLKSSGKATTIHSGGNSSHSSHSGGGISRSSSRFGGSNIMSTTRNYQDGTEITVSKGENLNSSPSKSSKGRSRIDDSAYGTISRAYNETTHPSNSSRRFLQSDRPIMSPDNFNDEIMRTARRY
ncbi:Oidioi.mRNA.OKI2018_I69.chr1.g1109.t1.cds [Oikopleura dioica]|uniref:Oidioi.mRNA.OKI2018_I69.chr1.g1109.t1.cds n=1 Tax=Oikopleura dioica TaxID=34765 RepID=A0ABN7SW48_OIKDI|nr:Oidioi.mRNA.OKI2018_I69.chr1.g1109.t1.cds [Oikopleura dioica]